MTPWPDTLRSLAQGGPYGSLDDLVSAAAKHRPGTTYDALGNACRRYVDWRPMDLVGDTTNDHWQGAVEEWDDEPTQPGISSWPVEAQPMRANIRIPVPRMTLVPGDIHCPIWDRPLVMAVLEFAESLGVDHLCLVGDTLDVYGASRFSKPAREMFGQRATLADELRAFSGFVYEADRIFDRVDYLCGNHEGRATERFVDENPWLYQHGAFDPHSLFRLPSHWHAHDVGARIRMGNVCIEHGEKLPGSGQKYGAGAVLARNAYQHTIFGHVHRMQIAQHTIYDADGMPQTFSARSVGHLSQLQYHAEYANQPNWQHGFVLVEHGQNGAQPTIHSVMIQGRRWRFGGREYGC